LRAANQAQATTKIPYGVNFVFDMIKGYTINILNLQDMRPFSLFLDRSKLSPPRIFDIYCRMKVNLMFFKKNYIVLFMLLCLFFIFTSFKLPILFVACAWFAALNYPWKISSWVVPRYLVIGVLVLFTILILYYLEAGAFLYWILSTSVLITLLHALFYTPPAIDEYGFGLETQDTEFNQEQV